MGSGFGVSVNDVLNKMPNICGKTPTVEYESARSINIPQNVLDISYVYKLEPKDSFENGLYKNYINCVNSQVN